MQFLSAQNQHKHLLSCNQAEVWLQPSPTLAFSQLQAGFASCSPRHTDDFVPHHSVRWPVCKQDKPAGEGLLQLCRRAWPAVARCWLDVHWFIFIYLTTFTVLTYQRGCRFYQSESLSSCLAEGCCNKNLEYHVTFSLSAPVGAWCGKEFRCHVTQPPQSLVGLWTEAAQEKQKHLSYSCSDAARKKTKHLSENFWKSQTKNLLSSTKTHILSKLQRACNKKFTFTFQFLTSSKYELSLSRKKDSSKS